MSSLLDRVDPAVLRDKMRELVAECSTQARKDAAAAPDGRLKLKRGRATIPLPGVDVPFHSSVLRDGVPHFRSFLAKRINPEAIDASRLIGKYIPNLIAKPFEVTFDYAQLILDTTASPRMAKVVAHWERDGWGRPENIQKLTTVLVVELLSYQFASPVQWIATQDVIFNAPYDFERFIEFGPSPTLVGMAQRTHKLKYAAKDQARGKRRAMLCHSKDREELYYAFADDETAIENEAGPSSAPAKAAAPAASAPAPVAAAPVAAAPVAAPSGGGGAATEVPDAPLKATDTVRAIMAQKLKKPISDIPLSKSVKDLVGGKSVVQNELIATFQAEFGNLPERAEELPLEELGASLNSGYSGSLGKYTSGLVARMVGGKLPGGFNLSNIKAHLSKAWGLGPGRSDGVLLVTLTQEPAKRLGSEGEAQAWLDSSVTAYSSLAGITLSQGGGGGGGGGGSAATAISSEELDKLQARHNEHATRHIHLLERFIGIDGRQSARLAATTRSELAAAQAQLDAIVREHGDSYVDGIAPRFDAAKARHFASYWNWSRQDAMQLFYAIIAGELRSVDRDTTARCITIINRADDTMLELMKATIDAVDPSKGPTYALAKQYAQMLVDNSREALGQPPVYKEVYAPTAPRTTIDARGNIVYAEVKREGVRKLESYVAEMRAGVRVAPQVNIDAAKMQMEKLWTLIRNEPSAAGLAKRPVIKSLFSEITRSLTPRQQRRTTAGRSRRASANVGRPVMPEPTGVLSDDRLPYLQVKRKVAGEWSNSKRLTSLYLEVLESMAREGTTFVNKTALLTGVGRGSIGVEIVKGLLAGGAKVIITTSSYSRSTVEYYQRIYQTVGARGSTLTVVPFNAASQQDVKSLVSYVFDELKWDLDYLVPFAAIPENGRQIDNIDAQSELAHRAMLTNVIRLMGAVKSVKAARGIVNRPTIAVLPLSPNHGLFGNDGLYSESKAALEGLSNRSISEGWSDYISVVGAVIGWCRSTGLMSQNDLVAEQLEKLGLRTFSSVEMAFNLLGCLHPLMMSVVQIEQVVVDLAGGLNRIPDLAPQTAAIRAALNDEAARRRAIALESSADFKVIRGAAAEKLHKPVEVTPRANFRWEFPALADQNEMGEIARLAGQGIDLNKVIVCTGFAEVSPWGSARTRWEYEVQGSFTIEGCIELAWIMGLIKFVDGKLPDGTLYVGWVDAKSNEPVTDAEVKKRYEKEIVSHSGIRLIEPELFRGYNPDKKLFLQEIEIQHDLEPVEVSSEDAAKYRLEHADKVDIWDSPNGGSFMQLKRGARINVPQAIAFSRTVAGQIPTGWSGRRFGIPEDIVQSVDRVTLWALVAISDALVSSGITDPYELYKYVHPSRVGTALGSGMGGTESLKKMFTDRRSNLEVQNDILQETFINTVAGWANLLLLSSSGPIVTPVGACATALQSINIASEAILSGKADIMIAGGYDDLSEEGSYEFANMKATSDAHAEAAAGREPSEMSRPTTTTRSGFMESQGLGTQILMSAATAIRLGCPIQSVVAYSSTHTDKQGRSVPAPGHGVMSAAPALQRALADWGMTADDIGAISIHGTSTKANDKNESHCYNEMFRRMGRTPSLAVPVMAQKWMVGHLKGGAAALATNALMQSILSHTVAGNRNADDISPELRQFSYLLYASQTIKRTPRDLNAGLLTSFGFGQVGGIIMLLHPNHLLARLSPEQFSDYASKRAVRQGKTYSRMHSALTRGDLVRVKDAAPYTDADMDAVLMNPNARARQVGDSFAFVGPYDAPPAAAAVATFSKAPAAAQKEQELTAMMGHIAGVGIDAEDISSFPEGDEFRQRNFTAAEIAYCSGQPDVRASFAGRWAAKEAVFKAMGVASRGGAAAMKDIEILASPEGPKVQLAGDALAAAPSGAKFLLSITHSSDQAVAIAHRV